MGHDTGAYIRVKRTKSSVTERVARGKISHNDRKLEKAQKQNRGQVVYAKKLTMYIILYLIYNYTKCILKGSIFYICL
jgi:hypothetical protein